MVKYYFFGGQRIAMLKGSTFSYLHTAPQGHPLSSTVMETGSAGTMTADQKYFAYGKQRDTGAVTTDHQFTGQKSDGSGLTYMNARYYDPSIGTFISADTIVPDAGNVFDYNRFMYVRGRVLNMIDPTGHYAASEVAKHFGMTEFDYDKILSMLNGNAAWLEVLLNAHDGDQISAWNSVLQSEAGGTFQLNAATGQIEIMSNGVAIPNAAIAAYAMRKPGDTSPLPDGYGQHNMGAYKLRNSKGEDRLAFHYNGVERCSPVECTKAVATVSGHMAAASGATATGCFMTGNFLCADIAGGTSGVLATVSLVSTASLVVVGEATEEDLIVNLTSWSMGYGKASMGGSDKPPALGTAGDAYGYWSQWQQSSPPTTNCSPSLGQSSLC